MLSKKEICVNCGKSVRYKVIKKVAFSEFNFRPVVYKRLVLKCPKCGYILTSHLRINNENLLRLQKAYDKQIGNIVKRSLNEDK